MLMMKYECVYEGWQSFLSKGSKLAINLNCLWSKCNHLVTIEKSH